MTDINIEPNTRNPFQLSNLPTILNTTATMINYLSLHAIRALITGIENDPDNTSEVKGLMNTILVYYFHGDLGFVVEPQIQINDGRGLLFRVRRWYPGREDSVVRAWVKAEIPTDRAQESMDELTDAIEKSNIASGRCWAILAVGTDFSSYEYRRDLPVGQRLAPWCPLNQSSNTFHVRRDCDVIHWMLTRMMQEDESPAH